jgi:hypothetical protein
MIGWAGGVAVAGHWLKDRAAVAIAFLAVLAVLALLLLPRGPRHEGGPRAGG